MDKQEAKRVKTWLYQISTTEKAIINLELAIPELEANLQNPPSYLVSGSISNYSGIVVSGGQMSGSKVSYVEWVEASTERLEFLRDSLQAKRRKVEMYRSTLEALKQKSDWGYMAGEILRLKYHAQVKPDKMIYTGILFISPDWYYKLHRRGLQFFFDVLPNVFER